MHWDVPERWAVSPAGKGLRKLCTDGCLHIFIIHRAPPSTDSISGSILSKSEISAGGKRAKASALLYLWQKVRAASARAEPTPG